MKIEKRWSLPYPPDQVYDHWVSSDTVIPPATRMEIEPVVGGHYRLIMEGPEFSGRNEGVFEIVEPKQRVRYSWEWNGDGEVTMIDVRFDPDATGTLISLTHEGFQSEDTRATHDSGWDAYIEGFEAHLKA